MIKVYKNYYIDADSSQYTVTQSSINKKTNNTIYIPQGYFSTLKSAIKFIIDSEQRSNIAENTYTDLNSAIDSLESLTKEIKSAIGIALKDIYKGE